MSAQHAFSNQTTPGRAHMRLMATTDLHVHILPYDYYTDRPAARIGLARTAALIAEARQEAANCLLVDNGDFLQGNPMGDYIAGQGGRAPCAVHPMFTAMNLLGYEAATLGNHEFNYGLDFLMSALAGAAFPVVAANIARQLGASAHDDQTLLPPYVILNRTITDGTGEAHPIRIGVIGFVPPQVVQWDKAHLAGRVFSRDIVATAAALVPRMKAEGADIIIALAHTGIGATTVSDSRENAATALARIAGIDALVTGHSHLVFPSPAFAGLADVDPVRGTICGKPAVMPGFHGSHLGLIDLLLEWQGDGWRLTDFTVEARPVGDAADHTATGTAIAAAVRSDHTATLAYARRSIGHTAQPLNTYFALLAPSPAVRLVADAQAAQVACLLAGTPDAALPILSAAAPFKTGGRSGPGHFCDVPAGDMALRHAADLYIFPNSIAALRLTGAELADWLERAVSLYRQITPGQADQPLIDADFPCYDFDLIHGLGFQIDLGQPARHDRHGGLVHPAARRIRHLTWHGTALDPSAQFIVATNSYRASGSGGFPITPGNQLDLPGRDNIRDILLRHIAETGTASAFAAPEWRFAPMPGTSVTFESGPAARAHLAEVAALRLDPLADTDNGFTRFRLHL
ncbi:MAG: bifunctional 2',3'-cyclic-nucleotide 2'-phosphodiesterase/3'-nucleotidase [Pseudorhodobacter sp.]|nr:bifunctional 2',3'-cyclic-nucleotide 2'-phosphodiesterase/3'-nucleotidase [Pseudorhodobacter sp.]